MRQLGIAVYPDHSSLDEIKEYLQQAHQVGYTRIFTSLLQLAGNDGEDNLVKFRAMIAAANELGFQTIVDINPTLFKELGVSYDHLDFFHELGVWGFRLDEGFTGKEEAQMTRNPFGLKVEINMSAGTNYLESIMSYHPDTDNLLGCHNFYPQAFTGLSDEYFDQYSRPYRQHNLHTAAFVSAPSAQLGPWPVSEGLPTMESDRNRPIATQVQHLLLTGMVDDVIIGNAFASVDELKAAAASFYALVPQLTVDLIPDATETERAIVLDGIDGQHLYRGDASVYLLRSTLTRIKYGKVAIPARPVTGDFHRGDVIVVNDGYARYKGEMQIALTDFPNDGRRNVVGRITNADLPLLAGIKPWMAFRLVTAGA
ncbi:DUF871 domain-containing protein [Lacticaseibacillus pantheris]|uniref:DUF871 domain-containing protein n=1 Tax=Lacticaseibacillus pantheris TaxID=171523 RepID=UPI002659E52D|nr:MupG family TIM beta-alpha barrel fold protein [Lacticaseibacillus pantheris]WKF84038.1 MupG family TIM beta-alpha barrel fold protein [Lacticaseibacillus pantheris]